MVRFVNTSITVDLETLEPHIIASYTIIKANETHAVAHQREELQKVSVVYDEYLLINSRKSVVLMFPNAL